MIDEMTQGSTIWMKTVFSNSHRSVKCILVFDFQLSPKYDYDES